MRKILTIILAFAMLITAMPVVSITAAAEEAKTMNYGLTTDENGTILLAGKPFYAFGENIFGAFAHYIEGNTGTSFKKWFKMMKDYNLPFIRMPLSGYSPAYYDFYDKNPDEVFKRMDEVVKSAEENQLGLIVSLMWLQSAIPVHVGEKTSQMANPNSKTVKYAKEYVKAVIERYKDSPAVWGWEIGNEYNLSADLCDENFANYLPTYATNIDGFDYITSTELVKFYEEIAKTIREADPFRIISNGNAEMRGFAQAAHDTADFFIDEETHLWPVNWSLNTRQEFYDMCKYFTPDPIDTLSFHFQHGTMSGNPPAYVLEHKAFVDDDTLNLTDYIKAYAEAAKLMKKAAYFGEFGDFIDMESAPDCAEKFKYVCECIRDAGIQIATAWHFQDATDDGIHGEKFKIMGEMNKQYQAEGLQDLAAYWDGAKDEPSDWAKEEVALAVEAKLVPENINSKFTSNITRSDFCDLIINMITTKTGKAIADVISEYADKKEGITFPDTTSENILAAAALGIVNGRSSGAFDPGASITRQEAAKMLTLAANVLGADTTAADVEFADAADIFAWAKEFINYVNSIDVMKGTNTATPPNFSPTKNYTREQSILTVYRLFNAL